MIRRSIANGVWSCRASIVGSLGPNHITTRQMVLKNTDRAAVHGVRPPVTPTVKTEEVEKEICKAKEEKIKKIEETEKKIDSKLKGSESI